ncbi:MAG: cation:proton antiporter [Candidatus Hadarchaeales archaeon]
MFSLLVELAVILLTARFFGELFERWGHPSVVGEILGGIILGPLAAGLVGERLGIPLYLSPKGAGAEVLEFLSQLGILLLLFSAGLGMGPKSFRRAGVPGISVATVGALTAFALGFGISSLFGWSPLGAAFAGGVLMATSVGLTVRTLSEIGKLRTKVGEVILDAAVIDDIWGILVLSVLAAVATGTLSGWGLLKTIALVGVFLALAILSIRVLPTLLNRLRTVRTEEAPLSLCFGLMLLYSALALKVGLAAITGAFFAGLALSEWRYARSVEEKLHPLGYGLLIPLFFFWCGVRVDLGALAQTSLLSLLFLLIALFDKVVGCGLGARLGGMSWRESLQVGMGMMPRMEVALIFAKMGVDCGAVGPQLFSVTVLVVLFTSLTTPFLVKKVFE